MVIIYELGLGGYWTGASQEIGEKDGMPRGWTRSEPPELAEGEYAVWGSNGWSVTAEAYAPPVPPPPILPPLTRRQLRLALLSIGVTAEDIKTHIAAITDPVDRAAALIEWEDATHYKRDHPLVADVAAAMELPPEQVDAIWGWAAGV